MALQLKQFGAALTTRTLAARIVRSEVSKTILRSRSVVLDFAGVDLITQSFADELVRDIVLQHGPKAVAWSHADPGVERILRHAIAARLNSPRTNRPIPIRVHDRATTLLDPDDSSPLF